MSEIDVDLSALLPADLPDGREAVAEGRALADGLERARSLFCEANGVGSEREWRERARAEGRLLHLHEHRPRHLGRYPRGARADLRERALARGAPAGPLQPARRAPHGPAEGQARRGAAGDRPGALDRPGLVGAGAHGADPAGGGRQHDRRPRLGRERDQTRCASASPTSASSRSTPGAGPTGTTRSARRSRCSRPAGLLSAFKAEGVCFDSYLEDGYPGVFHDYANYVGWAMLERYICEELIGAAYSCSWGGLTQDPVVKSAVTLALHAVNPDRVPAGFVQGDTIGNTDDFDSNMAVVSHRRPLHEDGRPPLQPRRRPDRGAGDRDRADPVLGRGGDGADDQPPARGIRAAGRPGRSTGAQIEAMRDRLVAGGRAFFDAAIGGLRRPGSTSRTRRSC